MTLDLQRTLGHKREHLRTLLAGLPGCGLTPAAATWPAPVFALVGMGALTSVAHLDLPYARVGSIDAFLDLVTVMSQPAEARAEALGVAAETLVIDTLDSLEDLIEAKPTKVRAILSALSNLPLHVVLLCHTRTVEDRMELRSCVGEEVGSFVDVALLLASRIVSVVNEDDHRSQRSLVRFMRAWPDARHPWILDRTGSLPSELPLTFEGDFDRLVAAMATTNGHKPAHQVAVASPPAKTAPVKAAAPPAPVAAPPTPAPVAPPGAQDEDDEDDDEEPEEPEAVACTEGREGCLGVVEPGNALDISVLRHHRPMCPPCEAAVWAERPKSIKRAAKKAAPAPPAGERVDPMRAAAPPPQKPAAVETEAVVPRGEVVGQFNQSDQALRDFLLNT